MKQEELNLILENHKKWLNDDGGIRADLRGANLSGANLKGADLRGANLRGADLWTAYLRGANLRGANLRGANLSGANLRGADLSGADLSGADLSGANLRSTIGNQGQIITIQTDVWQIVYTSDVMQIGCQRHSINDWLVFSDDHISKMDSKALEFWKKWKPILVLILERNK
ncbi:pentapeptide [Rheinheimera phage vB_RspM_Barba8A]|uniref:Pentapeptide n=3 Tax=Barbavirus barba18A TaxID=2734090 RepID=A0A4P8N1T0_9CAUD|nr:pentapeptide [Rheinheimera phage vB_RspM_Barba5A]QCQ59538.1 pentapeptide [Rheinheimera phage vB_RspM_Barba8A]QCQ64497.1 pentapeptide [Rheinheimera phage vB_RspM_Barba30A]